MRNGITHFAKQLNKPTADVQILILWDAEENTIKYKKMVRECESDFVKFNEILNVRFDLMNREAICNNFIANTLKKYAIQFYNLFHFNNS